MKLCILGESKICSFLCLGRKKGSSDFCKIITKCIKHTGNGNNNKRLQRNK